MKRLIALAAILATLSGCATCERHQAACTGAVAVATVLAIGAIDASQGGANHLAVERCGGHPFGCGAR